MRVRGPTLGQSAAKVLDSNRGRSAGAARLPSLDQNANPGLARGPGHDARAALAAPVPQGHAGHAAEARPDSSPKGVDSAAGGDHPLTQPQEDARGVCPEEVRPRRGRAQSVDLHHRPPRATSARRDIDTPPQTLAHARPEFCHNQAPMFCLENVKGRDTVNHSYVIISIKKQRASSINSVFGMLLSLLL